MHAKRFTPILASFSVLIAAACGGTTPTRTDSSGSPPPASEAAVERVLDVSPTGNDANPGTVKRPLRSVQKAADIATPGTVVRVAPGSYAPVLNRSSGTATGRIVFRSTTPRAAKIVSTHTTPWTNYGSYVDIVGFEVSAPGSREAIVSEASYVRLIGNHVYDTATSINCTNNGGAGINHARHAGTGNEIVGNWVHDIGPAGCDFVQGIYLSQSNGKIQNNVVYRVAAWGIHTWHAATAVTIANNLVFAAGTPSAGTGGGILVGAGDNPPGIYASDFVVANNIVVDSVRGISETGRIGSGNRYLNNLVNRNGTSIVLVRGTQTGTLVVDPGFVAYRTDGTGDYHLDAGSPASDAGTTTGSPAQDIEGTPRPRGAAPDLGPYER